MVRRVSGEPLDRYLDQHVSSARLRDTGFNPSGACASASRPPSSRTATCSSRGARSAGARARRRGRACRHVLDGVGPRRILPHARGRRHAGRQARVQAADGRDHVGALARGHGSAARLGRVQHLLPHGVAVLSAGGRGPSRLHRHLGLDRPAHALVPDPPHESRAPSGGGATRIRDLRMRVAAAASAALFVPELGTAVAMGDSTTPAADGGDEPKPARPASVVRSGLTCSSAGLRFDRGLHGGAGDQPDGGRRAGRRAIDLLAAAPRVKLTTIFTPEHGLTGDANTDVPHGRDPITGCRVEPVRQHAAPDRRHAARPRPRPVRHPGRGRALLHVPHDARVRDGGAARAGIPVLVLDRPNPITGRVVEGPLMDPDLGSFTGPIRFPCAPA